MFMCGIWWRSRFLSKEMKAVMDKKRQESLATDTGPVPVDIAFQTGPSTEPEYYQFTPAAIGRDERNSLNLPQAKGSPYDNNDVADSKEDETHDDDNDEDEKDDDDDY